MKKPARSSNAPRRSLTMSVSASYCSSAPRRAPGNDAEGKWSRAGRIGSGGGEPRRAAQGWLSALFVKMGVTLLFPPALPDAPGCQAGDDDRQLSRLDRLGDVHLETRLERAQPVFAPPVACKRDGWNPIRRGALLGFHRAHFLQRRIAILVRHGYVQNQHIWPPAARRVGEKRQRLPS